MTDGLTIQNPGPCACGMDATNADNYGCLCNDEERYVRNVARGYWTGFHCPEHRATLTADLRSGSMGEYSQEYEPLERKPDKEFAAACLNSWLDYARDEVL